MRTDEFVEFPQVEAGFTMFMRPLSSLEPETANTRLSQRCKKFTVHPRHAAITPAYSLPVPSTSAALVFARAPRPAPLPEIMVDLRLPPVPTDLKHVLPFLQRAQEVRARDPIVCYWSLYYVAHLGMHRPKTKENKPFLAAVVDQLEGMKRQLKTRRQITDEAAGSLYLRRFGFNVFEAANNEDIQSHATRATAKKFLAASYFLEMLRLFGPLDGEVEETIKYAKFKAGDIVRSLREGTTPTPGIPAVPNRVGANGLTLTPSNMSPQTNPILLSSRPSTFHSPIGSPTAGAPPHRLPQPNYPPAPTESGSGSAPVSPRILPVSGRVSPRVGSAQSDVTKPESVALPASGSSGEIPLPETASPRRSPPPLPRARSPLSQSVIVSFDDIPVKDMLQSPTLVRTPSPMKALQEMSATPAPVTQQSPPQLPPPTFVPTPVATWTHPVAVSPTMSSTMTIDSADTFTSSQLRMVIKSGSMAVSAAPRAPSPARSESMVSTSQSLSQYTESYTSGSGSGDSSPRSPLTPVFSVANPDTKAETESETGTETDSTADTSSVGTAMPSPAHDGARGREAREIMEGLALPPPATQNTRNEPSPLSLARNTPIPESPDTSLTTDLARGPSPASLTLAMPSMQAQLSPPPMLAEPTVVIPRSPTQPSPTSHQISPNSPSGMSPDSIDLAMAQNQSLKSAAELIDMELWKVYGRLDSSNLAPEAAGAQSFDGEEGMDIEVESGSSTSASSSSASDDEANQSETRSASSSEEQDDDQSVVSEMAVMSTQVIGAEGEAQQATGFELKSLIKTASKDNSTQIEAVVARKTVRFAPSVVGGLSPEVPKQILPPMTPSRDSPPLIIPSSAVVHAPQPLIRPKSLTIRPSLQTNLQPGLMSPTSSSPSYTPVNLHARPSGLVGFPSQPPPLLDNRPSDEFAIIPFHPSMSASHPPPSIHNNPAYGPAPPTALVHAPWTSSPTQGPTRPFRRQTQHSVDRETAALAQKYSRFAISSLNYMDVEAAKKELRAALALLEGET